MSEASLLSLPVLMNQNSQPPIVLLCPYPISSQSIPTSNMNASIPNFNNPVDLRAALMEKEKEFSKKIASSYFTNVNGIDLGLQNLCHPELPSSSNLQLGLFNSSFNSMPDLKSSSSDRTHDHDHSTEASRSCSSADSEINDNRPYKCELCGKRFRFKSNLFEHKSIHSQQSHAFVCPFCGKTCRLKGNLKKHLQVHVNSVEELEKLWQERFSRSSGRPRKTDKPVENSFIAGLDLQLVNKPTVAQNKSTTFQDLLIPMNVLQAGLANSVNWPSL